MIDTQKWQEIAITLSQHKLRTALTAFGVFWGVFMLTILMGAGKGLQNGVVEDFKEIPNSVWIWVQGKTQLPYQGLAVGRQIRLEPGDVETIKNTIASVDGIYAHNSVGIWNGSPAYTVYKQNNGSFPIQGSHAGIANIHQQKVIQGRYINERDAKERRKVAVIGSRVKELLYEADEDPIGTHLIISGIGFQVVGVYKSTSSKPNNSDEEKVLVPNDTLRYAFNQVGWVGSFVILPKPGVHASIAERDVKEYLHAQKKISPDDLGVIRSFNLQKEFEKIDNLFMGINLFSWIVAVGTIMAGAVGVGNIMLIVVKERTREIGLRKALGATPASIVRMIVEESVLITAISGYCGLVAGVFLIEVVAEVMKTSGANTGTFRNPEVDFHTALLALIVLIISGLLASLLPAAKAASVNPILALQDE